MGDSASKPAVVLGRCRAARRLAALLGFALLAVHGGVASAQSWREPYLKGLEHLESSRWVEAIEAFDSAIHAQPREERGTRLYGMRYGYYPHRDKGIALYRMGRYDEAVASLEESVRQGSTREAARYLDLARRRQPAVVMPHVFRGTWWDHYQRGLQYAEAGAWKPAIQDFRAARRQRDKEDRSARTYGVVFIEYFPVRELGIALYHDAQIKAAAEALERSLATAPTAKAAYYYNLARAALLRQSAADAPPPRITVDAPADGLLTNALAVDVRGTAESMNHVAQVEVNGEPQVIEAAAASQPFVQLAPLLPGANVIEVVATDLLGQRSRMQVNVLADREGPVVVIDRAARAGSGRIRIEGTVYDNVRLGQLAINGQSAPIGTGIESPFAVDVPAAAALQVEAGDAAGNWTRVRVPVPAALRPSSAGGAARVVPASWPAAVRPAIFHTRDPLAIELEALPPEVEQEALSVSWVVTSTSPLASVKINEEARMLRHTEAARPQIFSHILPLREGPNTITITAVDRTGKTVTRATTVVRKVQELDQVGSRLAVAVMPFTHKGMVSTVYGAAFEAMVDALVNQGRFKVVSRDQLENALRELKLSRTALVDQATAVRAGRLAAAEAILVAAVNESATSVEIYAQLINTETSAVLAARDVFDAAKGPGNARGKMRELAAKIKQDYPMVGGSVVTVSNQRVAVGMGSARKVRPDMKVIVYMEGEPLIDPQTKMVLDRNVQTLGEGTLKDVRPLVSYCVMDAGQIGRLDRLLAQKKILKVITK